MAEWTGVQLARMFTEAAKALAAQESLATTAGELVSLAVSVVPGADSAGLSWARNGVVETFAATDELASACDAAQYETGEGPCLQALWNDRILQVDDFAIETRWPVFASRAVQLGAGSLLACHLSSERGAISALNLYARQPAAFDQQSRTVATIYAAHATIALEFARLEADLRAAVETRQGIGQAVGIVMERHRLTPKQAFDLLIHSSQRLNVKLRELAEIVVETGIDPEDPIALARLAGQEAGKRAGELDGQLRTDPEYLHGSTMEEIAATKRLAASAETRASSSLQRAIEAKLAAAETHDRAARLHEKRAEAGRADAEYHASQAQLHRQAAEKDRAAASAEMEQQG